MTPRSRRHSEMGAATRSELVGMVILGVTLFVMVVWVLADRAVW